MKVIINDYIPFKGFKAMYFCGCLFVRRGSSLTERDIRHESIHHAQAKELLFLFFYLWYGIEYLVRLFMAGNAYRNLSFEREAYANEANAEYLKTRIHYSFIKYYANKRLSKQ